jgi:peptide/nickel transport system ATP-binding protein
MLRRQRGVSFTVIRGYNPPPMPDAGPLLEIKNLTLAFNTERGQIRPVQEVSFSVYPGQTLALVGESGCGKSVTSLSILRLIPSPPGQVIGGEIWFEGRNLLELSEPEMRQVRGRDIAMIFQEPMTSLNPVYTIGDQIAEAVVLHQKVSSRKAYEIAGDALHDVGVADPLRLLHEYPHQLSGGMRQRVMIAMALSCQPKLLIADEPTTALDVTIQAQILELLRKLQEERNMAILLITHDLGVVAENADVVAVMYASRIVEFAGVEDLFDSPMHPYTHGLFRSMPRLGQQPERLQTISGSVPSPARFPSGCKFHPRCARTRELAKAAGGEHLRQSGAEPAAGGRGSLGGMSFCGEFRTVAGNAAEAGSSANGGGRRRGGCGVSQTLVEENAKPQAAEPALVEVSDLKTHFPIHRGVFSHTVGYVKAVDGVSFSISAGKTLGLVGESGSGKTTVGRSILRLIPATGGSVHFEGQDIFSMRRGNLRHLRRQMQIIFQDPVSSLNPRMNVGNIIGEGLQVHGIARGRERERIVADLLKRVGMEPGHAARYPHEFSGGQRQRIGIARAVSLNPKFIVCDEPVSALDVSIQSQILNLLGDLQQERGIAYLFIAHNLAVVEHFSDDIAVMYLGRIVEKASAADLYANPKHPYTISLLSAIPEPDPRPKKRRIVLKGEMPSPANPPSGCPFHPRCPLTRSVAQQSDANDTVNMRIGGETVRVMHRCMTEVQTLGPKQGAADHVAACWLAK